VTADEALAPQAPIATDAANLGAREFDALPPASMSTVDISASRTHDPERDPEAHPARQVAQVETEPSAATRPDDRDSLTVASGEPAVPQSTTSASQRIRVDWDAATAAALSGEGVDSPHAPPPSISRADPDKLLEDIIREIVGDAAVQTLSSLHEPKATPATPAHDEAAVSSTSPSPEPGTVLQSMAGENGVPSPSVQASTSMSHDVSTGHSGLSETFTEPEPQQRSDARVSHPPLLTTSTSGSSRAPTLDVSRETLESNGGTPLADQIADETRRRLVLEEAVLPLPPHTRILTISNQKGGVGKTTSAVNLAAALARSGAHVLVIDLDPQGNASTALGVDHRSDQQSVYEVLVADMALSEVVRRSTEHERLDCVPATIHLAGAEIELVSLVAREQRLRRALDEHLAGMSDPYDYVFIDCPPSLGLLTINAFVAAREVLIPIQCEYYALEGLSQLLSNIELIEKHLNPDLRLSTILLTMYDSRTNLAQQVAQEVRDHFPEQTLGTIIPRSVRVSEAPSYGQSVISYDFASTGSLSYREAAAEIAWRGVSETEENH